MLSVSAGVLQHRGLVPGSHQLETLKCNPVWQPYLRWYDRLGWKFVPKISWSDQSGPARRTCDGRRLVSSVRAQREFSDSKPSREPQTSLGKQVSGSGYHPLEDVPKQEKRRGLGEARLTSAEVARTIAEVNHTAVIFGSVVADASTVIGTDLNYVVDEHGDFYFELNNDDEWIMNLEREQTHTVLIGYGGMEDISLTAVEVVGDSGSANDNSGAESSDSDYDGTNDASQMSPEDLQFWGEAFPGGVEAYLNGVTPETMGSLGAWGGFETLHWVHPTDFARKLATAATSDYAGEIGVVTRRLSLVGVVRRVSAEEEEYVQDLFDERFADFEDSDDEEEGDTSDESNDSDDTDEGLGSKRWKEALLKSVRQEAREAEERQQAATSALEDENKISSVNKTREPHPRGLQMGRGASNGWAQEGNGWVSLNSAAGSSEDDVAGGVGEYREECAELREIFHAIDVREDVVHLEKDEESGSFAANGADDGVDNGSDIGKPEGDRKDTKDDDLARSMGWERSGVGGGVQGLEGEIVVSWVALNEDGTMAFSSEDLSAPELEGLKEQLGTFLGRDGRENMTVGEGRHSGDTWVFGGPGSEGMDGAVVEEEATSFFKLEILKIQLDTNSGIQTEVRVEDFADGRPDILAHSAEAMIERINNGGHKVVGGLMNIVRREKGLKPEEVSLVGIDHLGVDVRVTCGIELFTVRLPFRQPATSEEHAEQLLKELFNPRKSKRGSGPGSWQFKRKSRKR